MRKLVAFLIIGLLIASPFCLADARYGTDNAVIIGPHMGPAGITPPSEIVKVRYGKMGLLGIETPKLTSGTAVVWDEVSRDGYTISCAVCENAQSFAGILVTDIETADSTVVRGSGRNVGYICVRGWCLANVDTSEAESMERLITSSARDGYLETASAANVSKVYPVTNDVGVLIYDQGTDGLMKVWLD